MSSIRRTSSIINSFSSWTRVDFKISCDDRNEKETIIQPLWKSLFNKAHKILHMNINFEIQD